MSSSARDPIGVVHYGLGPIGRAVAAVVSGRTRLRSVAAIDTNPDLLGRDLGELLGHPANGVTVAPAPQALSVPGATVAVLCTGSGLVQVAPQLRECIDRRLHVVSTCEELAYPWDEAPELAGELDAVARRAGVALLGTGVNPGFAMDYLPLVLTAVTDRVRAVRVHRVQNAGERRLPLQRKVGAGLSREEFQALADRGGIGHVGLRQSATAVAAALGWRLERLQERLAPVLAERRLESDLGPIEPGRVAGIDHTVVGILDGREALALRLEMAIGREDARDEIEIEATPPVRLTVSGGLHGDAATAAIVANAIPPLLRAAPGLRVMAELPPAAAAV